MPHGVYDRSLYPRSKGRKNLDPLYLAWRLQRTRQNRAARAIRSGELAKRSELLAALGETKDVARE